MRQLLPILLCGCSGALPWGTGGSGRDGDGDGWSAADGDCDDGDALTNPLGLDTPGDGRDQDCDGGDDEALDLRAVAPGDIVVAEFMADPIGVSPALGEWFELANRTEHAIDLRGLLIHDLESEDFTLYEELVIEGGEVVVIGRHAAEEENGGVEVDAVWPPGFGLRSDGDAIVLTHEGRALASVAWDPTWELVDGSSLSLDPDASDPALAASWCPGVEDYGVGGRGTPDDPNPPCPPPFVGIGVADVEPGELVVTEVMQNPLQVPNNLGEWFEVFNATGQRVNLDGLEVSDGLDDAFQVDGRVVVEAGAWVVFGASADLDDNGGVPVAVEWRWSFALANSGDTIRLSYGTVEIDEVSYDNGISFPDPEGAAMSLDPVELGDNDDGDQWCLATTPYGAGDLGTPGAANPPCP